MTVSFIGGGNWKTTDLSQVTDKLYHSGFEFTMLVVIRTDIIGSCKSNYHMIMIKYRQVKPYSIDTCCKGQYLNILGSKSLNRTFYLSVFITQFDHAFVLIFFHRENFLAWYSFKLLKPLNGKFNIFVGVIHERCVSPNFVFETYTLFMLNYEKIRVL